MASRATLPSMLRYVRDVIGAPAVSSVSRETPYSNVSRGKRRKGQGEGEAPDTIAEFSEIPASAAKRAWARLIKQVCEVDPLVCPHCGGAMRILAFIEQPEVIEKILTRLGLWPAPAHNPPVAGYPLPSAPQRVAPHEGVRSVQGPRDHAVGARGRRGPPGPAPGRPPFP